MIAPPWRPAVLVLAASLAMFPLWTAPLGDFGPLSLTVGRAWTIVLAALVGAALLRDSRPLRTIGPHGRLYATAAVSFCAWAGLSSALWGCGCYSEFGGLLEVFGLSLLALPVLRHGQARTLTYIGLACGGVVAAVTAMLGVDPANPYLSFGEASRLTGLYGNPNNLAYALVIPVLICASAVGSSPRAAIPAVAAAVTFAALVGTASRGGLIALAGGMLVLLSLRASTRRHRLALAVGLAAVVGAAIVSYPTLETRRAQNLVPTPAEDQFDIYTSGWDLRARGPIPLGPGRIDVSPRGVLLPQQNAVGTGASLPLGNGMPGDRIGLTFSAESSERTQLGVGLQDDQIAGDGELRSVSVDSKPRRVTLTWEPRYAGSDARAYVFRQSGTAPILLSDIRFTIKRPGEEPLHLPAPVSLGESIGQITADYRAESEQRDVELRADALRVALNTAKDHPVIGVGWGEIQVQTEAEVGLPLAAHNDLARYAAELGLVGLLLFCATSASAATAAWNQRSRREPQLLLAAVVAGTLGLLFVNATVASPVALPFAVCLAAAAALPTQRESYGRLPRGSSG